MNTLGLLSQKVLRKVTKETGTYGEEEKMERNQTTGKVSSMVQLGNMMKQQMSISYTSSVKDNLI